MRTLWSKKMADQLDLLDGIAEPDAAPSNDDIQRPLSGVLPTLQPLTPSIPNGPDGAVIPPAFQASR